MTPLTTKAPETAPDPLLAEGQLQRFGDLHRPWALLRGEGGPQLKDAKELGAKELASLIGWLPAQRPGGLGSPRFAKAHRARLPYVVGAMANGITSTQMVLRCAKAGLLAIFGAAGLSLGRVEEALAELSAKVGEGPWGLNLIYTPHERGWEAGVVDLCLAYGVPTVSASAYLDLSREIIRLRAKGLSRDDSGQIVAARRLIVKLSRVELARKFMAPAPRKVLEDLLQAGQITPLEAELAAQIPVASEITIEADSGGHTDNRPSFAQFPAVRALQRQMAHRDPQVAQIMLGAAGGLGTPSAIAAAFAMGADYVVTGSVNQACLESGSSPLARAMLAQCGQADVAMAPAADMFEMGVELQVLKRGTLFAMRAQKLYDLYREYPSYEAIPEKERRWIEEKLFRADAQDIWAQTQSYWSKRSPKQLDRAAQEPKHRMALLFRWYLGQASRWANQGEEQRQADFQIWCGPAMGAFNAWAKGSPLHEEGARHVDQVADALMLGAALHCRAYLARLQGLVVPNTQLAALEQSLLFSA